MDHSLDTKGSPREVLRTLHRHKGKALLVFVLTLGLAMAAIVVLPREYLSESRLFVRVGRESVTLDPTAATGETISVMDSREVQVLSAVDMLTSRKLYESVVDALGPQTILGGTEAPQEPSRAAVWRSAAQDWLTEVNVLDDIDERQRAIMQLEQSIEVVPPKKSTVIVVECRMGSPEVAQQVLDAYVQAALDQHVQAHKTQGSLEFFDEQAELLSEQLAESTRQLRDAKNESGLATVQGQQAIVEEQIKLIEAELVASRNELASTEAKVKALQAKIAALPERHVTEEVAGIANAAADTMRSQLYELEMQERDLLSRYTAEHPLVRAIREQVKQSEKILAEQPPERKQTTTGINPAHEQLFVSLLRDQTLLASLEAKVGALEGEYAATRERLHDLNTREMEINQLRRQVALTEQNYRRYADSREQARINESLEMDRITNVNVVQPASLQPKPVSPNKTLLLLCGLVSAVGGSIAVALFAEQLDGSLKTREEIEQSLDVPVLVSIPHSRRHNVLLN